jgi:hypothetical protein
LGQAGAIAGLLCVVLACFSEVVVEGHGPLPGGGCCPLITGRQMGQSCFLPAGSQCVQAQVAAGI